MHERRLAHLADGDDSPGNLDLPTFQRLEAV